MSNSTKRALRTALQVLVSALLAIPAMAASLPSWEVLGQVVVVAAAVSKIINAAEEAGLIPAWLKTDTPVPAPPADPQT